MTKIPASYHWRKASRANDIPTMLQHYAYFNKQMLTISFFAYKAYAEAWHKYFKQWSDIIQNPSR